jgi:hypothetical protein
MNKCLLEINQASQILNEPEADSFLAKYNMEVGFLPQNF